jgi:hypothetical protein
VIAMAFGVILFQPSAKYRQNNFISDVTVDVAYAIIFFNSLEYTDKLSPSITTSIIIKKIYFLKNSIEQKNKKNQKIKIV